MVRPCREARRTRNGRRPEGRAAASTGTACSRFESCPSDEGLGELGGLEV